MEPAASSPSAAPKPDHATVRLGAGLTRLGRPWGVRPATIPSDSEAHAYLAQAVELGVRTFDTAPSYGTSESRLGQFLATLDSARRDELFIATKFGEWWDAATGEVVVDHSYNALARSLDESMQRLERIDLLQLHRPSTASLASTDVRRAFAHARSMGVAALGASVSRVADARDALDRHDIDWLQFPYHVGNIYMEPAFAIAKARGCHVLVNRPFGMGALVTSDGATTATEAFRFILSQPFVGAVLSGTVSIAHLQENFGALERARITGVEERSS